MKWITSRDLINWAPQRDCQEHLPLLIRKLIRSETSIVKNILFPMGDNIVQSGWDGKMNSSEETTYLPIGDSVWEIGCLKDFKGKIEGDFAKRTENSKDIDRAQTTYVAVTPYVWAGRQEWIDKKNADAKWKDVKVYDGQVLEEWIESFPIVGAWLAKYLEKSPEILPLDNFWEEWSNSQRHKISTAIVLSGREFAINKLSKFLSNEANTIVVKSSTIEESIAFIAAAIFSSNELCQENIFSRTVIVDSEINFRHLISQRNPQIIIAKFEDNGILNNGVRKGHHIIVPCGFDTTSNNGNDIIELSRIRREGFEKGLQEMGFSREEADSLTRDSGQSISVLRRRLQFVQNQQPDWAKENHFLDIIPALLVGCWDESSVGDKEIVSYLAGTDYDSYITKISKWKLHKDAPVIQIGSLWRLTSALDSWSILAPFLLKIDFDKFHDTALKVLNETLPALDLEPEQRYMASMFGKVPYCSGYLKQGVCQSLILIAFYGESFKISTLNSSQRFVDNIIYEIFKNTDGKKLCSLNYYMPNLAEAAPEKFIDQIDGLLNENGGKIEEMFKESKGVLTNNSYHTGLLWALESLAVSTDYLLRVTLILGRLAQLDPGGSLFNRPINSLREIYVTWFPQIEADFEMRKTVLKKLSDSQPDIGWALFLRLLPKQHETSFPIHKCKWRFNTEKNNQPILNKDVWEFNTFLIIELLQLANFEIEKLDALIKDIEHYNINDRETILQYCKREKEKFKGNGEIIYDTLRHILSHHRSYHETTWSLNEDELKKIEEVYILFTPKDETLTNLYLFKDSWIDFPEGVLKLESSHEDQEKFIEDKRNQALSKVYTDFGIEGILKMVNALKNTWVIGRYVGYLDLKKEDEDSILNLLNTSNKKEEQIFSQNYITSKAFKLGSDWINNSWDYVQNIFTKEQEKVNYLIALPQNNYVFKIIENVEELVSINYWKIVNPFIYNLSKEDKIYVIKQLQKVNRHVTALDTASKIVEELSSEMLVDILYKTTTISSDENARLDNYDICKLFETIQKRSDIDKSKIINLEWLYLKPLTDHYSHHKPKNLLTELSSNPFFFNEILGFLYRPDNISKEDIIMTEEEKVITRNKADAAWHLFNCWKEIPGINENKSVNKEVLNNWIRDARSIAEKNHLLTVADIEIGKLLSSYPKNDTTWPSEEICELLDITNSEKIFSSFKMGIVNSRGVYSKSMYEGGNQERKLAEYYEKMARNILNKWPKTAAILMSISKQYLDDARREDESAQKDELGL